MIYAFWNNEGGTGKTSLAFQAVCRYAERNSGSRILAVDLCPQANLSELFMGGLVGNGSSNLHSLYELNGRVSIGGYFQKRLPSPYSVPADLNPDQFVCRPFDYNPAVPENVDLIAGDRVVELQANAIASLSNTQIPGTDTWIKVIDWLRDLLGTMEGKYTTIFIDTNPSFSMYTQIALSTSERLILPVMADDSSRRAIKNAFSLVHGIQLPSSIYDQYSFSRKLKTAMRPLPQFHLIVKNRLTQYMGPASAYSSVLTSIDQDVKDVMEIKPNIFTFSTVSQGMVDVRDFHTTGAVSFAEGTPFSKLISGKHYIMGHETQVRSDYLQNCRDSVDGLVDRL